MTPLTDFCRSRVEMMFPKPEERKEATELLENRVDGGLPNLLAVEVPEDFDGIRCAVLKLSEGDIRKLRHWVKRTALDWRVVLDAADFGHDGDAHMRWEPRRAA